MFLSFFIFDEALVSLFHRKNVSTFICVFARYLIFFSQRSITALAIKLSRRTIELMENGDWAKMGISVRHGRSVIERNQSGLLARRSINT